MESLFELSHPQRRILITQLMYPDYPVTNIGGYVCFTGFVDLEKMKWALSETALLLDSFGIRLCLTGDGYRQKFVQETPEIEEWNLIGLPDAENVLRQKAQFFLEQPFLLKDAPLFRLAVFRTDELHCGYVLCCHHLIVDGWTMRLFTDSVSAFYDKKNPAVGSYQAYLEAENAYLTSEAAQRDQKFWKDYIARFSPAAAETGNRQCLGRREEIVLAPELQTALSEAGKRWGGVNTVLCTWAALMDTYRSGKQTLLSVPNYNRVGRKMRSTAGMFTSTVLLAVSCAPQDTIAGVMDNTRQELWNTLRHQRWPYDLIKEYGSREWFRYSVNCYNMDLNASMGDAKGSYKELYPGCQAIPFQIVLNTWTPEWKLALDLRDDLFQPEDARAMIRFLGDFLREAALRPENTLGEFATRLEQEELARQRQTFFLREEPPASLSHQLDVLHSFENGEETALFLEEEISRKTLAQWLAGAAADYRSHGLKPGSRVAILLNNSAEYVVYTLAAAMQGLVFIPLDPEMPIAWLDYILHDAEVETVVSLQEKLEGTASWIPPVLHTETAPIEWPDLPDDAPAYLLYTSGTTGTPKGVQVSRGALASYLDWARCCYCAKESLCFYLFSSSAFDLSITTVFLPLTSGCQLTIAPPVSSPIRSLPESSVAQRVTALKATPSHLELLLQQDLRNLSLRVILCGGEELTVSLAERLQQQFGPECRIYNEYGPTECTVGCMCYLYHTANGDERTVSIGKAAPGCSVYVADENGRITYGGRRGEIYIAGRQLADGYFNQPDKTAQAFVNGILGEPRVYRTGDLAYYADDGTLAYLGRTGHQRKINGYRVELAGIEAYIKSMPGVTNASVWVEDGKFQQIYAAVETSVCEEKQIHAFLAERLPSYSLPHRLFLQPLLPLNRNGKVDTAKLQTQVRGSNRNTREILFETCRRILNYHGTPEAFDYFLAGGDSVKALLLSAALEEQGVHLSIVDILDHPRLVDMADRAARETVQQGEIPEKYPLPTHLEYLRQTCDDFTLYRHLMAFRLSCSLTEKAARKLHQQLCTVLPALCTGYDAENGLLHCKAARPEFLYSVSLEYTVDTVPTLCERLLAKCEGLFAMAVLSDSSTTWLGISLHHILADGTTWKQLLDTIVALLSHKTPVSRGEMAINRLDTLLDYRWAPLPTGRYEEYRCFTRRATLPEQISAQEFMEACSEVLGETTALPIEKMLCDWDARALVENGSLAGSLGCFSVFLPVVPGRTTVQHQIQDVISQKYVELPGDRQSVRVNYLGDLSRIVPEEMTLLLQSLEISLRCCSAYGCLAEITCVVQGTHALIFLSTRDPDVLDEACQDVLELLERRLCTPSHEELLGLSEEELDLLLG